MSNDLQRNLLMGLGPMEEFSMVPDMSEEDMALEESMPAAIQKPEFKQRKALEQTIKQNPVAVYEQSSPEKKMEIESNLGAQFVQSEVDKNPTAQPGSLKGKWLEALTYLAPQIGGALVGGLIGGNRGVTKGYEVGTGLRKQFDDLNIAQGKLQQTQIRANRLQKSEDVIDSLTGEPLSYDPSSGKWKNSNGEIIPGDRLRNLREDRVDTSNKSLDWRKEIGAKNYNARIEALNFRMDEAKDLGNKEMQQVIGARIGIEATDSILSEVKNKNIGPIIGRARNVAEFMGLNNPEFTSIQQQIGFALADYQRAMSGLAVTDAEAQRLRSLMPKTSDTWVQFQVKAENFKKALERLEKVTIKTTQEQQGRGKEKQLSDVDKKKARLKELREKAGK